MISKHITLKEATYSPTALKKGISNEPNDEQLSNMMAVAEMCFEPLRNWYGKPIKINSFFRSEKLNKAIGGASGSQHTKGMAIDLTAFERSENIKLFNWLKANTEYDQVIAEDIDEDGIPSWVHISYNKNGNRKQILNMKIINKKAVYSFVK